MNFHDQLRRQLNYIVTSCRAYDSGLREEATRIAVVARVLFHDTSRSHSLVRHHLGASQIKLRSTTAYPLPLPERHFLGFIGIGANGEYVPYIDRLARDAQVLVNDWWSVESILEIDSVHSTVTRRDVVLGAANHDGGAHVDPAGKKPLFTRLEKGLGMMLKGSASSGTPHDVQMRFANFAILRQIGHEILSSEELRCLAEVDVTHA